MRFFAILLVASRCSADASTSCGHIGTEEDGAEAEVGRALLQVQKQRVVSTPPSMMQEKVPATILQLSDVFLYDHLPKAGGSFVRGVLAGPETLGKVIPVDHLRILEESHTLSAADKQLTATFTVGSVSNPCDYYVSFWSFFGQITVDGNMYGGPEYFAVSDAMNTAEDQRRFGEWLRYTMPGGLEPGELTARVLWSYFNESVGTAARPEPTMRGWSPKDHAVYAAAAEALDPSSVDCWIHTETLTDDLRKCLTLYEARVGPGIVNWNEYETIVARQTREHKEQSIKNTGGKNIWTKNSDHPPCEFLFEDQANVDYVLKIDHRIFKKFGYSKCCGKAEE